MKPWHGLLPGAPSFCLPRVLLNRYWAFSSLFLRDNTNGHPVNKRMALPGLGGAVGGAQALSPARSGLPSSVSLPAVGLWAHEGPLGATLLALARGK